MPSESAIVLLEVGDAGAGGTEDQRLLEEAVEVRLARAAEPRGAAGLESAVDGGEVLPHRLEGVGRVYARFQH